MEQAQYWMLMRRRNEFLKSHFQVSMNSLSDSWEEKAFAEDSARSLGGYIWPPRSYSCSFCKREFRSAQALGGHMNVHRRDRARLKQSLSDPNNQVIDHNSSSPSFVASSFSAFSRVSGLSTQENFTTSSIVQEELKGQLFGSDSTTKRSLNNIISSSKQKPEAEKSIKLVGEEDSDEDDHVETNLSVGLNNSGFFQNRPINYKRPKINDVSKLPFLVSKEKYYSSDLQWQVLGLNSDAANSMEDLDLELRLGVLQ